MATDTERKAQDIKNAGASLLKTAIGVSPLIAAAYYGGLHTRRNEAINVPVGRSTPVQVLERTLGKRAGLLDAEQKAFVAARAEQIKTSITKDLGSVESLTELFKSTERKNALLQALAVTLDDPSLGIDEAIRTPLKQQLQEAANIGVSHNSARVMEDISKVMTTLANSSNETVMRFAQARKTFSDVGSQLRPAMQAIPSKGVAYNVLPSQLTKSQENYVSRVQKALSGSGSYFVDTVSYKEVDGKVANVAHIYEQRGADRLYKASLPLGGQTYRTGESGRTLNTMPRGFIDANIASTLAEGQSLRRAYVPTPEHFVRDIEQRARAGGRMNWADVRTFQSQYVTNVDRVAGTGDVYGTHVLNQANLQSQRLGILNLDKISSNRRAQTYARIATRFGDQLDAGIGAKTMMYRGDDNGVMGNIGRKKGSLYDFFQRAYGADTVDRSFMPITAREHQLTGRAGAFAGGFSPIGKTGLIQGSVMEAAAARGGSFTEAVNSITGFGSHFSGATGKVMIYDVGGKMTTGGIGGEGMSYVGRSIKVQTPLNLTVLDPKTHHYLSSDLLDRAAAAGDAGVTVGRDELRTGVYAGETSNGAKTLPFNERVDNIHLRVSESTTDRIGRGSKSQISFAGRIESNESLVKVFGVTAKSMIERVDDQFAWEDDNVKDIVKRTTQSLGVDVADVWHGDASQLGKSGANMLFQVTHGAVLVSGGNLTLRDLDTAARVIGSGQNTATIGVFKGATVNQQKLGRYVQAAMHSMHANKVGAEQMGLVLGAVYHGAKGDSGAAGYRETQAEIMQLARTFYGKEGAGQSAEMTAFLNVLKTKKALGFDYLNKGDSDWGRGRMGVEPRYAKALQERLMLDTGLSMSSAADVVTSVYKNKVGFAQHYRVARDLTKMTTYLHGGQGASTFMTEKAARLNWNSLFETGFLGSDKSTFASYLKKQEHGVVVDFGDAPEAVRRALEKVFPKGELFFPGQGTFEDSRGTILKLAEGSTGLEGPLGKLVDSFQGRLLSNQARPELLEKSMREWKEDATKMFTSTFHQLSGGKIKGGASPIARGLDVTEGVGFGSKAQLTRARELVTRSKSAVATRDTEGFLSQMLDLKGTESEKDSATRAQRFFTEMEHSSNGKSYRGIYSIVGRDPQLGPGNVQIVQTFRDLREVSALGGKDEFYERFKSSDAGKKLLTDAFGAQTPQNFADPRFRTRKAHKVFQGMMDNLSQFTSGEAHGSVTMFGMTAKGEKVGSWTQAFGDFDGDHATHFFLDGPNANKINKALRGARDGASAREFRGRMMYNEITNTTKDALGHVAAGMSKIEGTAFEIASAVAEQDIQKEIGLSMNTGRLDVSMRKVHEAVLQHEEDPMAKQFNRQLLAGLQEHFVIKSKKLEKFTSIPEEITKTFSAWGETGSDESFEAVRELMNRIFGKTQFANGGISITAPKIDGDAELQEMWSKHMGKQQMSANFTLENFLTSTHASVKESVARGQNRGLTEGSLAQMFENSPGEALDYVKSHGGLGEFLDPVDTMGARTESAFDSMRQGLSKVDAHMTGKLAMGALASAVVFGMLNGGVAPEPIIMPGENVNSRVNSQIASGNLFSQGDPQVSPEASIAPGSQYGNMPPINTGATYATRPNSYQIRGEVSSGSGLSNFGSYFNQLTSGTGRGVITINDQRRPITRNYMDRMLGEY